MKKILFLGTLLVLIHGLLGAASAAWSLLSMKTTQSFNVNSALSLDLWGHSEPIEFSRVWGKMR